MSAPLQLLAPLPTLESLAAHTSQLSAEMRSFFVSYEEEKITKETVLGKFSALDVTLTALKNQITELSRLHLQFNLFKATNDVEFAKVKTVMQNSLDSLSDSIKALGNETKLSIDEINGKLGAFPTQFTQAIDDCFAQLSQQNERRTHEIVQEYAVPQQPAEGLLPSDEVMPSPAKQETSVTDTQDAGDVSLAQVIEDKIDWSEDLNDATNDHEIFNASKDARIPKFRPYNDSTEETAGEWLQDFVEVLVDSRVSKSRWPVAISSCLEGSPIGWWHAFRKKYSSFSWTLYRQAFLEAHEERNPAFTARRKIKALVFKDMDSYIKNFRKLVLLTPPGSFTDSEWVDRFCEKLPSRYCDLVHDIQRKNIVDNFEEVVQEACNFKNGNVAVQSQFADHTTKDSSGRQSTHFNVWKKVERRPMSLHATSHKSTRNSHLKSARRSEPRKHTPTLPAPVADENTKCYHCHKLGHFSRDCPQRTKRAGMHTLHMVSRVDHLPKINVHLPDGLRVFMLADTGASHNYVAGDFLEFLQKNGTHITERKCSLEVIQTTSSEITTASKLVTLPLIIAGQRTRAEFVWHDDEPALGLKLLINGHVPPRRRSPAEDCVIHDFINESLENGTIRHSSSAWSSPVHIVPKPDGKKHVMINYCALNRVTRWDAYPIPHVDDPLNLLAGSRYFTSLDFLNGFWQIPMKESHKGVTAFSCQYGHFEWNVMPMGLTNVPAMFQRAMNDVLADFIDQCCIVYLDDITVFSPDLETHKKDIDKVCAALKAAGFVLSLHKCHFAKEEIKMLGHIINSGKTIMPNPAKVEAITTWPFPADITSI
ncbi:hypothetical protein NDA10_007064 [Ustilago hordei]|nr:hypothetical protein NDA10_007064 [Ustilago hordei]